MAAEQAAQTIKDAYKEARNAAVEAADALGEARSKRAKQLFSKDSGINQFLSGGALGARRREGLQLQRNEAGRLKRELVKSFTESGNFLAAQQIGQRRFKSFDERQKFIDAAREELYGQKALITANEKLEKALSDLNTTIIKGFDGGSTAQREDYQALKDSIDSLVQKDWSVGVEARLEADGSISIQNAIPIGICPKQQSGRNASNQQKLLNAEYGSVFGYIGSRQGGIILRLSTKRASLLILVEDHPLRRDLVFVIEHDPRVVLRRHWVGVHLIRGGSQPPVLRRSFVRFAEGCKVQPRKNQF